MPDSVNQLAYDLAAVAQRLRAIGEDGLVRELSKGIGKAVEPVPQAVRAGLAPRLPDRYAAVLDEDLRMGRTTSLTGEVAHVRVYAATRGAARRRLKRLDDGILWHPTFGNRKRGRYQDVEPGWFTGPVDDSVPQVREGIEMALRDVAGKAAGKGIL